MALPVDALPLDAFRPDGVARLYLLGGAADISRVRAEQLLRPLELIALGARIGAAAAKEAADSGKPAGVRLPAEAAAVAVAAGEVRELLVGVRPIQKLPTVSQEARNLPVLGRYDVVVIGGGTGGAPAGIGAAREGAKVLVVEYLHMLGGRGDGRLHHRLPQRESRGFLPPRSPGAIAGGRSSGPRWWPDAARRRGRCLVLARSAARRGARRRPRRRRRGWPRRKAAARCWPTR